MAPTKGKPTVAEANVSALHGEAHKVFERFARFVKDDKKSKKKNLNITKPLLGDLVRQMHREQRLRFAKASKIDEFVETNFHKYDENHNGYISIEEVLPLWSRSHPPLACTHTRRVFL